MSTNPPRTPPRRDHGYQMWTPGTPRYAPMDEPDMFPGVSKRYQQDVKPCTDHKAATNSKLSKVLQVDSKHKEMAFPPTPEQTPFNRKRKNLDIISHTSLPPSGRILFPTPSPAKGTGRAYKHHRTIPFETPEKPEQSPSKKFVHPAKKAKISLNDCLSTSYASSVKRAKISFNDCPSTTYVSPMKKSKVSLDDCPSTSYKKIEVSLKDCPATPARRYNPYKKFSRDSFTSPPEEVKIDIFDDVKALKHELNNDLVSNRRAKRKVSEVFDPSYPKLIHADETKHPHDTQIDPTIPGLWCNFRGKKVFRPFAKGSAPLSDYKPRVLFGPRRDTKSLEEASIAIPKKSSRETTSQQTDTFTKRLRNSTTSKTMVSARATTPEIDSEEDSTDCEDTSGNLKFTTTTVPALERRNFVKPALSRIHRATEKKHFFR